MPPTYTNPNPDPIIAASLNAPAGIPLPTISVNGLQNTETPIQVPPVPPVDTGASLNSSIPTPQAVIAQFAAPTGTEAQQSAILKQLATYVGDEKSLATQQIGQEGAAGVPALNATVRSLSTQLQGYSDQLSKLQIDASAGGTIDNKNQLNAEGRGITVGGNAPLLAGDLRRNQIQQASIASQALTTKAAYYAANNDYLNAKDAADKAAQVAFDADEQKIKYQQALLASIQPQLNKEEAARSALLQTQLSDRAQQIGFQREDFKTGQSLAIAAMKLNPNDATVQLAAQQALKLDPKDPQYLQKVMGLVGEYQRDPIAVQQALADLAHTRLVNQGLMPSPVITTGTGPVQTVQTAKGATPISTYKLQPGDDPYNIAQQNGIDMATLKSLNPQVSDWTKLPVGYSLNLPNQEASWLNGKSQAQVDAYNNIPAADKASIKQLVTGDALLTDIVKSRGANTQAQINKLITEATAIDPSFSVNANKQRYLYKTQFNNPNGKEQTQINAINTGLGHLAEFKSASDALGNKIVLPYNQLVNYLKVNTGDPAVSNLNTVITALSGELASVYKGGTAPTDQETEQWRNTILASFSKSQAKGVTDTTANLVSNKLQSLAQSYKNIMGGYPESPIINNDVLSQLQAAGVDTSKIEEKLKGQGYPVSNAGAQNAQVVNGVTYIKGADGLYYPQ